MTHQLDIRIGVPGVDVVPYHHANNPAKSEDDNKHFKDGWFEFIIQTDGTNPYYQKKIWRVMLVFQITPYLLKLSSVENTAFVVLQSEDKLEYIAIAEERQRDERHDVFGLWINVLYRNDDGLRQSSRLLAAIAGHTTTGAIC